MPLHPDEQIAGKGRAERRHRPKNDINPVDQVDVERLRDSINWSEGKLTPFRERYYDAVKSFAGQRYGNNTELDKTPVNFLHLAVEIWLRQLVAQTPRSLVLTRMPELKTGAFELEIATNYLLEAINFGDSLSECVRMAIFQMGVMKVGLTSSYLAEANYTSAAGQPFADPVMFEDWIHDMTARRKEEWAWCGNRYRLPYDIVMQNKDYNKSVLNQLQPRDEGDQAESLRGTHTRTSRLSASSDRADVDYLEQVDLIDIWIPGNKGEKLLVTLPAQQGLQPLEVREWEGPDNGPYHLLGFAGVPGNVIPSAPAQNVFDLQGMITELFNQLGRQALRQKTLTIVDGRAEADGTAERIMNAQDGQVIRTSHIDGVKEMKYGGVAPENQAFLVYARELFSYLGGNIDAMGGLAQQAGTLGQEELLVQSSSEMVRDMQAKVLKFTESVVHDCSWYMYTDPFIELPLTKKIEDYGEVPFIYTPDDRQSDFFNYHFQIQPHSLRKKGPSERLQALRNEMMTVLLPLAPQLEQMGVTLNLQKYIELVSKYGDLPEIEDIISSEMPTPYEEMMIGQGGPAGDNRPRQSPVTQRNYTRKNVSTGGTQQTRDNDLQKSLMSAAKSGGQG